ncbi:amidohydrolase [Micrococcoides hystricis]|uniref:Amidohydrolase n=1 Tax=Micrococcoides hystricis TaxID=1572761 RepID=A0ABV6PAS7_9MICC
MSSSVDLLIINGYVPEIGTATGADATSTEGRPTTVAVSEGQIVEVGGAELEKLRGPETAIVDANGGAILPGINDGHLHFCASAVTAYVLVPVGHATDWAEIHEIAQNTAPGADGWVRGHGWDDARHGAPDMARFFELNPDVPTVLFDQSGHQLIVNGRGLEELGLSESADDVAGGVVGRRDNNAPNGHFADAAMGLVNDQLPALPAQTLLEAFSKYQADLHALGITSLTEPGLGPGGNTLLSGACGEPSIQALVDLAKRDQLRTRLNVLLLFSGTGGATAEATTSGLESELTAALSETDDQWLRVAGVKVFADGTPRSGTAWMKQQYCLPCGHGHGGLVIAGKTEAEQRAELNDIIAAIHNAGLQAGVHATGDATTEAVIEAFAHAAGVNGKHDLRHYVIHGAFENADRFAELAEDGFGVSTNPAIRAAAGALMTNILGEDWYRRHQPLGSLMRHGVHVNIASDSPVTSPDWRNSVIAAVTRASTASIEEDSSEGLSLSQALAAMTSEPAWQDKAEQFKGRIEPGYVADICVLSAPLPKDVEELRHIPTATTIVGGEIVYSAKTNK